ncbi:MAG: methionyl-tRNA formyltransferase [Anaerolineales bacterium]|nr:methionyl-tRNA formyltransferase [Anaerolineales bacterium]
MDPQTVFMGSPEFALPALRRLSEITEVVGVVTQPDRQAGRGKRLTPPPVKVLAEELGIEVFQPRSLRNQEAFAKLAGWQPELIVVAAYGQILPQNVLDLPQFGCINLHASLLPRWRGAAPINAAILHGDALTGITIMKMDAGLDTGPILAKKAVPILAEENAGTLSDKLSALGGDFLAEVLPQYLAGEILPTPQPDEGATYAPMLSKQDGELDFNKSAEQLARQVRGYYPWPGSFMYYGEKLLKVHEAYPLPGKLGERGTRRIHNGLPAIAASDGLLVLKQVQPAGKKAMSGEVFLNGARDWQEN